MIGFDRSAFDAGPSLWAGNQNVNRVNVRFITKVFRSILPKIEPDKRHAVRRIKYEEESYQTLLQQRKSPVIASGLVHRLVWRARHTPYSNLTTLPQFP